MQRPALVGRRVDRQLLGMQLGELGALRVAADAPGLVGEIDSPLIPGQLPGDRDPDLARRSRARADRHPGTAQRPGEAGHHHRLLAVVEAVDRTLDLRHAALRRREGAADPRAGGRGVGAGPRR